MDAGSTPCPARRRRRPCRVRPAAPSRRPSAPQTRRPAPPAHRPGHGIADLQRAGAADHHRQRPLRLAQPPGPLRRGAAGARAAGYASHPRPAGVADDPVLGMAPRRRRPRPGHSDPAFLPSRPAPGGSRCRGPARRHGPPPTHPPASGPWTAAETLQRTFGAPDALTLGDLYLPVQIGYALTGHGHGTDETMLLLLAPCPGQRHRAARLILLGGPLPDRMRIRPRTGSPAIRAAGSVATRLRRRERSTGLRPSPGRMPPSSHPRCRRAWCRRR